MSTIFISHSSHDRKAAEEMRDRLEGQGYKSLFLDFSPESGITAGAVWEKELYQNLKNCRALILLCSPDSMNSKWCFTEAFQAKSEGKLIFPVKLAECAVDAVVTDRQIVDLSRDKEEGYARLWAGLKRAGLDPRDSGVWDSNQCPYPGLSSFEEAHAAVYFGRKAEVAGIQDALIGMRRRGDSRFLMVLGPSGCGKSSLVRAGLIPGLKRDPDLWRVLPPIRPGKTPVEELAYALTRALAEENRPIDWPSIDGVRLCNAQKADSVNDAASACARLLADLVGVTGVSSAGVVLVVDQFEELLGRHDATPANTFLKVLRRTLEQISGLFVIGTMRSDFLGQFQLHKDLQELPYQTLPLSAIPIGRLSEVIEGPAALSGISFEPGLTLRMVQDTGSDDALPLLAFTLEKMYHLCPQSGPKVFTTEAYETQLGGIQGSVARVAEEIITRNNLSKEDHRALRTAFLKLVRLSDDGKFTRQRVRWSELPEKARPVLNAFITERLLVAQTGNDGEREVEIAHEALFRVWKRAEAWLSEGREFLSWRRRLSLAIEGGTLLRGSDLAKAKEFLSTMTELFTSAEVTFIRRSLRGRWIRRSAPLAAAAVFLLLAWWLEQGRMEAKAKDRIVTWGGTVEYRPDLRGYSVTIPSSLRSPDLESVLTSIRNRKILMIKPDATRLPDWDVFESLFRRFPLVDLNVQGIIELNTLPDLARFDNLVSLNVSFSGVTNLPGLEKLTRLRSLTQECTRLPPTVSLGSLVSLRNLIISGPNVKEIRGLENLPALESLAVSDSPIPTLDFPRDLKALRSLSVVNCKSLTNLIGLEHLSGLWNLDIHDSTLTRLPGLGKLVALRTLNVSRTDLSELSGLDALHGLESLDISDTHITDLPGVTNLKSLRHILIKRASLQGNLLSEITNAIRGVQIESQ